MCKAVKLVLSLALTMTSVQALASEIRVMCYSDGNECEATEELAGRFEKANADIKVIIDKVPYKAVLESLPVQLAAGNGPDIARTTDFTILSKYLLDLRPYIEDADYWERNFGPSLDWMRATSGDKGIYGLLTQLTVTGPIVNKTLFDQANVALPGKGASWDDWAAATRKVAKATGIPFAMAFDRTGHRFAGFAISMGAKYFDDKGEVKIVDPGFREAATKFLSWHKDGTMPKEVWGGQGGGYKDAFAEFANAQLVMYVSGSWQVQRLESQVGNAFDWIVAPNPCGPAACTGMPGGAAFVAFKGTKHPLEVARFLDFLASEPIYAEWMAKTNNIPAHLGLQKAGIAYRLSPQGKHALAAFGVDASELAPLAYKLQGDRYSRTVFNATVSRLAQAIVGELTLDAALQRIDADFKDAVATAKQ